MPRDSAQRAAVPGETAHSLTTTETPEQEPQDHNAYISDPDAAIDAGRAGNARRIAKPLTPVAPAVLTVPDETRPDSAAINAKPGMSIKDAKELDRKARLQRPVMTVEGWYCPRNSLTEQRARKKNQEAPIVEID